MANEIAFNITISGTKGGISVTRNLSDNIDWTLARKSEAVQNIATTAAGTALVFNASVTTLGVAYFNNLDVTNFVEIGVQVAGTFYPLVRCKAGEPAGFRITPGITVYARADTAAVDLEFGVLNN